MEDVVVEVYQGEAEVASKAISSPITAAEAKDALRDINAAWVGMLTEPDGSTVLAGRRNLTPGAIYHLHLQEQPGRQKLQGEPVELPPDDPRKLFWRNLADAKIEDNPGGFQVLRLQCGFLDPGNKISSILLRPCYKDLWNLVSKGSGKDIITGTPGVGKSIWQYYAMYKLAKLGATVVVDFKGMTDCLCFSKDSVREGPLTAFKKELLQEDTWYLVDTREPEKAAAKTILTSSPKREIYKDFAKAGASTLYMPVWSWLELDAGRHLHGLRKDEILPLYEKWGGSARYVLDLARNPSRQRDLASAIAKADLDVIFKAVGEIDSADEVSHRVLHINVAPNYLDTDMMFASEFIGRKVGEKFCKGTTLPLQRFIAITAGWKEFNDVCAKLFEPLAHRILRGGGVFDVWDLEMGTQTTLKLPPCTSFYTFHDLKDVADQEAGTYCIPSRSDQAAIDSIQQPQYLFRMTLADEHSINATGLSHALEQLRKDPKTDAELFFAVPPDQYPRWRKKQEYTGRTDLKVLRAVKQRVIKVPLKMMVHSLQNFRAV
ncbi:hypothetical protein COCSUDRAFT_64335 [Coccomyxa subellipsoidea C-169]|uniref:Uncharacterized protein n=1 Tax=Coccomyxa subellipsoidea (strain C-169) TaxID=574566 RepID=I0ZAL9_COCSC|nr:hypothetical protein COCSUDRAFT_64335 [Coccomyxa subellipsoidea C-169]EIE27688.1 hypothetical protein COCSUDRAFT_64335 [Coccomyxa subellipsoidea C-169]|eukprot:XP_005652232.1 hypothetical protein COCSUDRAFT_64335 [Coccomyxa subellipsoidea C-169]